jgi:hypothetical protein
MKALYFPAALAAALFIACPANAIESVDVESLTCGDFTQFSDDDKAVIMMWFEGYYTEEDEPATIDFNKMAGHLAQIMGACEDKPDMEILEATDEVMDDTE